MSVELLRDIKFEDDNHYNLFYYTLCVHRKVNDPQAYSVEKQEWHDRYKVSLGDNTWYVETNFLPKFFLMLGKEGGSNDVLDLEAQRKVVRWSPTIPYGLLPTEFALNENDPFYQLVGVEFTNIDDRMTGLVKAVGLTMQSVAKTLQAEMRETAKNTDIVKDFDGILTFDPGIGKEFNVKMCFDKVPPVYDDFANYVVERTPITNEDLAMYLPLNGEKIVKQLDQITELVQTMFRAKNIAESEVLTKYAADAVTTVMTRTFLNQTIKFIQFGGNDVWTSNGKETPNNKACFVFLDQEVDRIFTMLETIPKEEGVEVYSMDIDTFAIFGRKDNKVVTAALQGYVQPMLDRYSEGFEKILSERLKWIDSPHVFKA